MSMRARKLRNVLSLADLEALARRFLPRSLYAYVSGACEDGLSLAENRRAFDGYALSTRVLVDTLQCSQDIELFGERYAAPFGIAPMGIAALTAYRGDVTLARGAHDAGLVAIMSSWSLMPMERVSAIAPRTWFQAYFSRNPAQMDALIDRIEAAGFQTLVVTVDTPAAANRENNVRAGFTVPLRPSPALVWQGVSHPRWLFSVFLRTLTHHGIPHFENWHSGRGVSIFGRSIDQNMSGRGHLTWQHVANLRKRWKGKIVLKGILNPADAALASVHGIDGIIVSNHGGRQLDGAVAPLRVLPQILESFQNGPVMLDGSVRRGTDVLKAIALGATCVFIGRPFNYAAALAGTEGVEHTANLLKQEIARNMAMIGVTSLKKLNPSFLVRV